ncbi:MAG: hypothetical protein CVU61_02605 [Deltaproteobacteria bacterium HGW-Deltaproteobacteria-19]|nr:MAG: hypothetical protein CVU61_02605 [Deltaproteobacteria bacterium HGW-Deltaproteobacteria-19]
MRRTTGNQRIKAAGGTVLTVLLLAFSLLFCPSGALAAPAGEESVSLPKSGIPYPGGFDRNTVGEIRGKVTRITVPASGPVQIQVLSGRDPYTVLASPSWYWKDIGAEVTEGTELRVRGSKALGADGNLYMIAQEIRFLKTGQSLVFRDEAGRPFWTGARFGSSGGKAGFGSPLRGPGGSVGGPGGAGRGRR